ncbi:MULTISPECIES: hypothetical protein [Virgibacillus]|uniref:Protein kinase family protein n=2 Tax=Virgibacillus TaxID=84406 RepID=A0A024Q9D2_9BACI|nr:MULTISPECIES: hypothetical protein [Virgibacillus]EQB37414.1 hypothetical protein M948_02395 [Virgibacillus sp. CM-4]GGJ61115.1 putative serine/threonine-protein kinase YrzF [Virgibacillus kapii]CDQ39089.1 hypothetical protein BN990_01372 [Virgibacillus massiliensis]
MDTNTIIELAESVNIQNEKQSLTVAEKHPSLEVIGVGRSAVVFKIKSTSKALKVFPPEYEHIASEEAEIYQLLNENSFFPKLYQSGKNYLLIDYINGYTLYDCLTLGIPLTEENIKEADFALKLAKQQGLNPSDIHLRNIILTPEGNIKLIDVARFRQLSHDHQWDDIKFMFSRMYFRKYSPKKVPAFILNGIAYLYKKKVIQVPLIRLKRTDNK